MVEVWFFYIMTGVVFWAFNVIVDKFVLTKYLNAFSYYIVFFPPKIAALLIILLLVPVNFNSIPFFIAALAGFIAVFGYYFYAFSMQKAEASRVYALSSLYPAFVAVFAAVFLGEIFSPKTYVGIALMIGGVILISYKSSLGRLKKIIPIAIILMTVGANLFYAVEQTMSKFSLNFIDVWQVFAGYLIGNMMAAVPSLAVTQFRKNLIKEIKGLGKKNFLIIQFSASLWLIGVMLFYFAAALGPITLVSTLSIVTPFAVLLVTITFSKFWPKILKEEIDKKTVALKFLAVALIFLGTYLIVV